VRPATGGIGTAEEGFAPWVAFAELETALPTVSTKAAGVYVVVRDEDAAPRWLMPSPVGETWRGDPTVSVSALDANIAPERDRPRRRKSPWGHQRTGVLSAGEVQIAGDREGDTSLVRE